MKARRLFHRSSSSHPRHLLGPTALERDDVAWQDRILRMGLQSDYTTVDVQVLGGAEFQDRVRVASECNTHPESNV
jgi:hypothetical protein